MSGKVVNLNRARKDRERSAAKQRADENAIRFGRTKAERLAEAAREARMRTKLDAHRFDEE